MGVKAVLRIGKTNQKLEKRLEQSLARSHKHTDSDATFYVFLQRVTET